MAACSGSEVFSRLMASPDQSLSVPSTHVPAREDSANLEELMERYQRADRDAAAVLVRELSPKLLRFLAGPLQTRVFAEDMLQDCWLRIHRARHTYRPGSPVLVVTGQVNSLASEAARSLGVRRVLGKPLRYETLISALRDSIQGC